MKGSKFFMTCFVVVLILSFAITTVVADADLPVTVDTGEDGRVQSPDWQQFTVQPENYVPSPDLISIDGMAEPISPVLDFVYNKRPTFYFKRDLSANKYRIEVYDYENTTTVYTYAGSGTCTDYYCSLRPDTKLDKWTFWVDGEYGWRVQSRVGGVWQAWSGWAPFIVMSKGYFDSFTSYPWLFVGRWSSVQSNGFDWVLTSTKSMLKAPGATNWWSTVYAQDKFNNVDYTVRMKRKYNETNANAILIWADLFPASGTNELNDGIYFQYDNKYWFDGKPNWSIWQMKDGAFTWIQSWTPSSAIIPFGWNEMRIVGQYPYVDLWINGTYIGWFQVDSYNNGVNAIASYAGTLPDGPLLVDWAKATAIPYGVTMTHDPSMQLGLDAGPATLEEVTGGK
jgi:hypothetical protein